MLYRFEDISHIDIDIPACNTLSVHLMASYGTAHSIVRKSNRLPSPDTAVLSQNYFQCNFHLLSPFSFSTVVSDNSEIQKYCTLKIEPNSDISENPKDRNKL